MRPLSLLFALTLAGCATGAVAPHTRPELSPREGLVLVVVDTNVDLESVVFSPADGGEGFVVAAAPRGVGGHLFRVPAGDYRLTDFRTSYAAYDSAAQTATLCVRVTPQRLAYPGHLVFRDSGGGVGERGLASWGWRENKADAAARVATRWPGATERYPMVGAACP